MTAVDSTSETNEVKNITPEETKGSNENQNEATSNTEATDTSCKDQADPTDRILISSEETDSTDQNANDRKESPKNLSTDTKKDTESCLHTVTGQELLKILSNDEANEESHTDKDTSNVEYVVQKEEQSSSAELIQQSNETERTTECTKNPVTSVKCGTDSLPEPVKFSCIGSAQKVSIIPKPGKPPQSAVTTKTVTRKRTEKFVVKNISKVSKLFKASNLSYKIKPVLKNAASKKCPIVYVGEPAFIDLEDFPNILSENQPEAAASNEQQNDIIKEDSLYDIAMLQSAFLADDPVVPKKVTPSGSRSLLNTTYPSLASDELTDYSTFPKVLAQLGTRISSLPNGVRIIAKPIQSAVAALRIPHIKQIVAPQRIVPNIKLTSSTKTPSCAVGPVTSVITKDESGVVSVTNPIKFSTIVSSVHSLASTAPKSVISVAQSNTPVGASEVQNMKVLLPKQLPSGSVMTVNFVPSMATSKSQSVGNKNTIAVCKPGIEAAKIVVVNPTNAQSKSSSFSAPVVVQPKLLSQSGSQGTQKSLTIKCITSPKHEKSKHSVPIATVFKTVGQSSKNPAELDKLPSKPNNSDVKPQKPVRYLREGVEVAFEDDVCHFISNLKLLTHLDDEPVKSWSELKKGTKVAARWTDGLYYDATITGCYFTSPKIMQPSVKIKKCDAIDLPKSQTVQRKSAHENVKGKLQRNASKHVGCVQCREVFSSVFTFRDHQRKKCRSTGIIVPHSTSKVTDSMIAAVSKDKSKMTISCSSERNESSLNNHQLSTKSESGEDSSSKLEKQQNSESKKRPAVTDISQPVEKRAKINQPVKKRAKVANSTLPGSHDSQEAIFKKGTKFLHRWQLDDGEIKWYHGQVIDIVSKSGSFLDWEFEVSYKGEDENYILKLYEDYPADIRLIGKM